MAEPPNEGRTAAKELLIVMTIVSIVIEVGSFPYLLLGNALQF